MNTYTTYTQTYKTNKIVKFTMSSMSVDHVLLLYAGKLVSNLEKYKENSRDR